MKLMVTIAYLIVGLASGSLTCPGTFCAYQGLSWSGRVCGQLSADGSAYIFNPTVCANSTEYCAFTNFNANSVCLECLSTYCYNFNGAYRCTENFNNTSYTYPQTCTIGTECLSEVDSVSGMEYSEPCRCGFNLFGQGYCPLFPGSPLFQNLTALRQKWLDSDEIKKCNTFSRPETNEYEWCLSSVGYHGAKELLYVAYYSLVYPQIAAAEQCYLEFVAYDHYLAMEESFKKEDLALVITSAVAYMIL